MAPRRLAGAVCLRPRPTQCSVVAFVFRQRAEPSASRRRLGRVCDPLSRHQARSDQPERREQKHYDPTQDRQSLPGDGDVHRRRTSDTGRDENRAAGARLAAGQRPAAFRRRGTERRAGRTSRLPAQRGGASPLPPERASRSTAAPRSQRRSGRACSRPQPASDPAKRSTSSRPVEVARR